MNTDTHPFDPTTPDALCRRIEVLLALRDAATQGPWHWAVEDVSLASLEGPRSLRDHVLSVSPCRSCCEAHKDDDWAFGHCMTPTLPDARFIAAAPEMAALLEAVLPWLQDLGDTRRRQAVKLPPLPSVPACL